MRWPVYRRATRIAWTEIDEAHLPLVEPYLWRMHSGGYPIHHVGRRHGISLHRHLLGLGSDDPREGDHINGDKLDNRLANLRIVTHAENMQNVTAIGGSSKFRGVYWSTKDRVWRAQGHLDGKPKYIGSYRTEEAADKAAADWRAEHFPFSNPLREETAA